MEIIRLNPALIRFVKLRGQRKRGGKLLLARYVVGYRLTPSDQCHEEPREDEDTGCAPPAGQGSTDAVKPGTNTKADERKCEHRAEDRDSGRVSPSALLLTELEETNNWARLGLQLYSGWFAVQFIVNGIAMSWFFASRGSMPAYIRLVFGLFAGWSLMGIVATFIIRKQIVACDLRSRLVFETLSRRHEKNDLDFRLQSPIPRQVIMTVFVFCTATMLLALTFWTILLLWPEVLIASPAG